MALLSATPVTRAPTVMCDRKDTDLIGHDRVDDAERETSRDKTTFAVTPYRAEARILEQQTDGVLEFGEERL
jgi:hypothetical protein